MEISGKTKVCALIGDPVEHSLSPIIHNTAFSHLELDFVYVAFKVKKEDLKKAVNGVRSLGIHGLNVTTPHKETIIKYLDELDPVAKNVRSVNTVLNINGELKGFNTDGVGALNALKSNSIELKGKKLLLLGAGGAAKAIAFSLISEVEELRILNRTGRKARQLAKFLCDLSGRKVVGEAFSPNMLRKWLISTDILINATVVGMHPNVGQTLVKREWLRSELAVMDIVYNPLETQLIKDAKAVGASVVCGTEMLIFQGAASFEIWCRRPAPVEIMKSAVVKKLKNMAD